MMMPLQERGLERWVVFGIVADEIKEWIACGTLRERWLEVVCARWQTTQGDMLRKHNVLIEYARQ